MTGKRNSLTSRTTYHVLDGDRPAFTNQTTLLASAWPDDTPVRITVVTTVASTVGRLRIQRDAADYARKVAS
jgi:hypothetical protein